MNISVEKTNRISSTKAVRKEQRIVTKLAESRKLLSMYANDKKNVGCQGDFSWKTGKVRILRGCDRSRLFFCA